MGTKLTSLETYFDPGLSLTVWGSKYPKPGKEYDIPLPNAEVGLWCRGILVAGGGIAGLDDNATDDDVRNVVARLDELKMPAGMEDKSLSEIVLGSAYAQMAADGVPDQLIEFCGTTAYLWIALGDEVATRWWQSGGSRPEAARPANNRAEKRAASKAKGTGATSTAAASTTRSRASTTTTSTPKKSSPATAAKRSRGKTSSATGT